MTISVEEKMKTLREDYLQSVTDFIKVLNNITFETIEDQAEYSKYVDIRVKAIKAEVALTDFIRFERQRRISNSAYDDFNDH